MLMNGSQKDKKIAAEPSQTAAIREIPQKMAVGEGFEPPRGG